MDYERDIWIDLPEDMIAAGTLPPDMAIQVLEEGGWVGHLSGTAPLVEDDLFLNMAGGRAGRTGSFTLAGTAWTEVGLIVAAAAVVAAAAAGEGPRCSATAHPPK